MDGGVALHSGVDSCVAPHYCVGGVKHTCDTEIGYSGQWQDTNQATTCKLCNTRVYQVAADYKSCNPIACPVGKQPVNKVCVACPAGEEKPSASSHMCSGCASGRVKANAGTHNCAAWTSTCNAGQRISGTPSATADRQCVACTSGQYQDLNGHAFTSCKAHLKCDAGERWTGNSVGATQTYDCTPCNAANDFIGVNSHTLTACTTKSKCSPGEYLYSNGDTSTDRTCRMCQAGRYRYLPPFAAGAGHLNTECTHCPQGKYGSPGPDPTYEAGACTDCGDGASTAGTGTPAASGCDACLEGFARDSSATQTCQPCVNGKYQDERGRKVCKGCDPGYKGVPAGNKADPSRACQPCENGAISTAFGSTSCSACPAGEWPNAARTVCEACPAGKKQTSSGCTTCNAGQWSAAGSTACTNCLSGRYSTGPVTSAAACTQCPAGKTGTGAGKTSEAAGCVACANGEWSSAGSNSCYNCPTGRKWTSTGCEHCTPGLYQDEARKLACKDCPSGRASTATGATALSSCAWCAAGQYTSSTSLPYAVYDGRSYCSNCLAGRFRSSNTGGACDQCPTGQYQQTAGSSGCRGCPSGRYVAAVGSDALADCEHCEVGRYQNDGSQSNCELCSAGFAQGSTGRTVCGQCSAGYAAGAAEASACSPCSPGFVASGVQATTCALCGSGRYQDVGAQSACKQCTGGKYRDVSIAAHGADGSQCFQCAPGYFTAADGVHSACTKCPVGKVQPAWGATTCSSCNWGKFMDVEHQTTCKQCPEGRYEDRSGTAAVTQCKACPKGHRCPSKQMTVPTPCATGNYQASTLQQTCGPCVEGTIAPTTGLSVCEACGTGQLQPNTGQSTCDSCIPGKFTATPGLSVCQDCGLGTYTGSSGLSTCADCGTSRYADSAGHSACKLCMEGTHQDATGQSDCKACTAGKYSVDAVLATAATWNHYCKACGTGKVTATDGLTVCSDCTVGHFMGTTGQSACLQCNYGTFAGSAGLSTCATCPAGRFSKTKGTSLCSGCEAGSFSVDAAGGDLTKFYRNMYCIPCPPGAVGSGLHATKLPALLAAVASDAAAAAVISTHGSLFDLLGFGGEVTSGAFPSGSADIAAITAASMSPAFPFIHRLEAGAGGLMDTAATARGNHGPLLARVNGQGCMMCTPGRYKSVYGLTACANCPNGQFQKGHGHVKCEACGVGRYAATATIDGSPRGLTTGATHCWSCPTGRHANRMGQSTCDKCPLGYIASSVARSECSACPAGQFADSTGLSTCQACPTGRFTMIGGQSVCQACDKGTYMGSTGATVCQQCAAGRIAAAPAATVCAHCPDGRYVGLKAQSTCKDCRPGTFTDNYSTTSVGAAACTMCARGHYAGGSGATECTPAEAGKFVLYTGRSAAELCAPGSYTPFLQQGSVGPYDASVSGELRCVQCPAGTYCPDSGHNLPSKAPAPCPAGRWGAIGLQHADCSGPCPEGYRCPAGTSDATKRGTPCGAGFFCPEGTGDTGIAVSAGHYCTQPQSSAAGQRWSTCRAQARCEAGHYCSGGVRNVCPAGTWQPNVGKTALADCNARQCSAGFFCPEGSIADQVRSCAAPGATHPAKYYCPAGTAVPREATDYVSASNRGQYTDVESPATHRKSALVCPAGSACWNGVAHAALAFDGDSCPGGTLRVQAASAGSSTATAKTATLAMTPKTLAVLSHTTSAAAASLSTGMSYSMGALRVPPGCTASNPFSVTSAGVLSVASGSTVSPLTCPFVGVDVTASAGGAAATCTVIASTGAAAAPMAPSVAAGTEHACYIKTPASSGVQWGGDMACFGPSGDASGKVLNSAHASEGWVQVAVAATHTCGLKATGSLQCVGTAKGAGIGTEHVWTSASSTERFLSVAVTDDFTCAISAGSEAGASIVGRNLLQCRGGNARLSSGYAAMQQSLQSLPVAAVALGPQMGCLVQSGSGALRCFGAGASSAVPAGAYTAVAVGDTVNACAIRSSDSFLVCWGPLWGGGMYTYSTAYSSVAVGSEWLCGVTRSSGALQCFGMYVPRVFGSYSAVPSGEIAQVSARGDMLCLLTAAGAPACYGGVAMASGNTVSTMVSPGQTSGILALL